MCVAMILCSNQQKVLGFLSIRQKALLLIANVPCGKKVSDEEHFTGSIDDTNRKGSWHLSCRVLHAAMGYRGKYVIQRLPLIRGYPSNSQCSQQSRIDFLRNKLQQFLNFCFVLQNQRNKAMSSHWRKIREISFQRQARQPFITLPEHPKHSQYPLCHTV